MGDTLIDTNRRSLLAASGLALAATPALAQRKAGPPMDLAGIAADLDRYVGFGKKASGGEGDLACGAWLEGELHRHGFTVERQAFDVPWFEPVRAELKMGDVAAPVVPQAIAVQTPAGGISGRLVRVDSAQGVSGAVNGAILLLDLPHARWSSALAKPVRDSVTAGLAAGAAAAVIIPNGPTGKAVALNANGRVPMFNGPVAVLGPESAKPFLAGAAKGLHATLFVEGTGGRRAASNFVGRLDRGKSHWLIVSTPRSGWFTCAGERGPGVVAWLSLARWAARNDLKYNLAFLNNSGHEYEYLGAENSLKTLAPPPDRCALWLHLGANVAARDWHEIGGTLLPLRSADPQRFLVATENLLDAARRDFSGLAGLESPYPADRGAAGELSNILAAGYPSAAGIFGAHRFHHTHGDDARCVDAVLIEPVIDACKRLMSAV